MKFFKNYEKVQMKNINFNNEKTIYSKKNFRLNIFSFIKCLYILLSIYFIMILFAKLKKENIKKSESYINLDKYEIKIYNEINNNNLWLCSRMCGNKREFLNGVVRKFKPKKILEIGVAEGGSSIIILNAIKDIKNSHLFSIDLSKSDMIGFCVKNIFKKLSNKWSLFTGNIPIKFMKEVGNNIEMVFIDSGHYEPGEILDFLIVLPFLKEEAIVIFHDIGNQITKAGPKGSRRNWAPYKIFNIIRGTKFYPSGNQILTKDIGAIKLYKNQFDYIHDYFRTLGGQWDFFPEEEHIDLMRKFIKNYYDNDCSIMFEETVNFNRKFVKNNPVYVRHFYNSITKKIFLKKKKKITKLLVPNMD
jgi:predicted O-methyltransferase YrrM